MTQLQLEGLDQAHCLDVLSRAQAEEVKQFAEELIPSLGEIEVLYNRTGLTMLPMQEPVKGTMFYLGEVLIAEAWVRISDGEGYAACLGRDVEQALALALIDAANLAGLAQDQIAAFVKLQAAASHQADDDLLRQVEATRVEMETFEWLISK
ncbi:MAG: phosphonate C-P lyase system protein PhnG [Anaerolineae bacterium]|nr:phosphonate C-P lyase system protein PhnG [Anaerolineae bacterium]